MISCCSQSVSLAFKKSLGQTTGDTMIKFTPWVMAAGLALSAAIAQDEMISPVVAELNAVAEETPPLPEESAAEPEPMAADLEAFIDGLMASYQATYNVPGYGLSVVTSDETLISKGYGLADVEAETPVTADGTRFHVASISKTFVWTSVMMLVDRGLLDLDTNVNVYLMDLQMPEGERPLTLNDLMAHKGGFEDGYDIFSTKIDELSLIDAMKVSQPDQIYPRGETVAYSNWGTNLAAVIVADVAGQSYADFLFTEILEPLGMTGTALGTIGEAFVSIPASKNYGVTPFGPEEQGQLEQKNFAPIGGMSITPADMAKWMRFHLGRGELDGVRLLNEETYALMRERAFDGDPLGSDMAHGFSDRPFRSLTVYGHDGSINSIFSTMVIAPDLDLAVFLTQNSHSTYRPIAHFPTLLMDRVLMERGLPGTSVADETPSGEQAVAAAEELAGRYITSRRPVRGFERFPGGMGQSEVSAKDGALSLNPEAAPYLPIGPDLWENARGQRLAVLRHEDGSVRGLLIGFGAAILMPVTPATDIYYLAGAFGFAAFFLVTTYLGLWRRLGGADSSASLMGRVLALAALGSAFPMILLGAASMSAFEPLSAPYGELFADYPPAEIVRLCLAASLVALVGFVLLASVPIAWTSSGWSIWRKLHHSALGLSLGAFGIGLIYWGLAFNELVVG